MASKNSNGKPSTKRVNKLGLLSGRAMEREQKDFEEHFKEKVEKDRLVILQTLKVIKENHSEAVIVYLKGY